MICFNSYLQLVLAFKISLQHPGCVQHTENTNIWKTNIWKYQCLKDQYLKIIFWKIPISERPVEQTCKFRSVLIRQILSDMVWIPNVFFHIRIEPHTTNLYIFYPTAFFIKTKKLIQYFTLYVIIYNLILVILWKDLIIKNLKNDPEERIRIHIPIDSEDPHSATATATAT